MIALLSWLLKWLMKFWYRDVVTEEDLEALNSVEEVHTHGPRLTDIDVSLADNAVAVDRGWVDPDAATMSLKLIPNRVFRTLSFVCFAQA